MNPKSKSIMVLDIINSGVEFEEIRKYGTVQEFVEAIKPYYEDAKQEIKEKKNLTDEQCYEITEKSYELKDNFQEEAYQVIEPKMKSLVRRLKWMSFLIRIKGHKNTINKTSAHTILGFLAREDISSKLSKKQKILLKGYCLEGLSNDDLLHVSQTIQYMSGATEEEKTKDLKLAIEDKYLIFSKYNKTAHESVLIRKRSPLTLLYQMLPEPMREEVFNHKDIGDTLNIKLNKYGDYEHQQNNDAKEKFYIDSFVLKFIHVGLYDKKPTEFNNERFEHPDCPCATVKALADALSVVKKKYFTPNPLA